MTDKVSDSTPVQPSGYASTQVGAFEISSNSETKEQLEQTFAQGETVEAKPAGEADFETEKVDVKGKTHAKDGKFKGQAKAQEDKDGEAERAGEGQGAKGSKEGEVKPERPSRAKDRIHELVEERKATERELEAERKERAQERERLQALEAEVRALRQPKPTEAPKPQQAADEDKEPDFNDPEFANDPDGYTKWIKTHNRWAARQEAKSVTDRLQREAAGRQYAEKVKGEYEAFESAISEAGGPEFSKNLPPHLLNLTPTLFLEKGERPGPLNALADEIIRAGTNAPVLLRYLSEHEDVYRRISTAPSRDAFNRELGKIEAHMEGVTADTSPSRPFEPKAKPPVRSVTGSPLTPEVDLSEVSDFDQYMSKRNAEFRRTGR